MSIKTAVLARSGVHRSFEDAGGNVVDTFTVDTPFGQSNPIHEIEMGKTSFFAMSRHGEKGYEVSAPFVNDRANIWGLKEKGVEKIISWSAPGSLNPGLILFPLLFETVFSSARRLYAGRAPWKGDLEHIYNLLYTKWGKKIPVLLIYSGCAVLFSIAGFLVIRIRP